MSDNLNSQKPNVLRDTSLVLVGLTALLAIPTVGLYVFDEVVDFIIGMMPVVELPGS
ncbi:hypothetical protein J3454_15305 [Erythrobacter sp. NFXS35]|uniref:hypothetical protein n=1 Tax=Erythrobacter sp. NFXS35 TaxID=2818436 RepID=UPI0032DEB355